MRPWGNVCSAHARRATFLLTIPTLPSHGELSIPTTQIYPLMEKPPK